MSDQVITVRCASFFAWKRHSRDCRAEYKRSSAFIGPIRRGKIQEEPCSAISPLLAKAVVNFPPSAM